MGDRAVTNHGHRIAFACVALMPLRQAEGRRTMYVRVPFPFAKTGKATGQGEEPDQPHTRTRTYTQTDERRRSGEMNGRNERGTRGKGSSEQCAICPI